MVETLMVLITKYLLQSQMHFLAVIEEQHLQLTPDMMDLEMEDVIGIAREEGLQLQ